jgi:hypothetical protein
VLKLIAVPDMAPSAGSGISTTATSADTLQDSATGADAGDRALHGTDKALAITTDCTPRYVQNDP